jgi:hypothetical protein
MAAPRMLEQRRRHKFKQMIDCNRPQILSMIYPLNMRRSRTILQLVLQRSVRRLELPQCRCVRPFVLQRSVQRLELPQCRCVRPLGLPDFVQISQYSVTTPNSFIALPVPVRHHCVDDTLVLCSRLVFHLSQTHIRIHLGVDETSNLISDFPGSRDCSKWST